MTSQKCWEVTQGIFIVLYYTIHSSYFASLWYCYNNVGSLTLDLLVTSRGGSEAIPLLVQFMIVMSITDMYNRHSLLSMVVIHELAAWETKHGFYVPLSASPACTL